MLITQDGPTIDSYLPHMERHPKNSETLVPDLLHKEISPLSRDIGSHQLLYKHQTSTFLRYTETLYLSHYIVHRHFSFTSLTFRGFLAGTTLVPSIWSLHSYSQVPIEVTWILQLIDYFRTSSLCMVIVGHF